MPPHLEKIDEAISPGVTSIKWNSLDTDAYVDSVYVALHKLDRLITSTINILTVRVDQEIAKCTSMLLCELPENEPWTTAEFLTHTKVSILLSVKVTIM